VLQVLGLKLISKRVWRNSFATPFGFVLGWISSGIGFGLVMLVFGVLCWAVTFVIGKIRPEST
jgi:hypothetical protein